MIVYDIDLVSDYQVGGYGIIKKLSLVILWICYMVCVGPQMALLLYGEN